MDIQIATHLLRHERFMDAFPTLADTESLMIGVPIGVAIPYPSELVQGYPQWFRGGFWLMAFHKRGRRLTRFADHTSSAEHCFMGMVRWLWHLLTFDYDLQAEKLYGQLNRRLGRSGQVSSFAHETYYLLDHIRSESSPKALELIRTHLTNLVTSHKHMKTGSKVPVEHRDWELQPMCARAAKRAAHLEWIVTYPQQASSAPTEFERTLAQAAELVHEACLDPSLKQNISMTDSAKEALELAIIAAFRNAIKHHLSCEHRGGTKPPEAFVSDGYLIIENHVERFASPHDEGKPDGTLAELRRCARVYGGDGDEVELRRMGDPVPSCTIEGARIEKWIARLPLPQRLGGLG